VCSSDLREDVDLWLHGTPRDAAALLRFAPAERYRAAPATTLSPPETGWPDQPARRSSS
jgi:hypothetical protein